MNQNQIQKMMQQAQKMQKDMEKEQSKIDTKEFSYSAGGGIINIVAFGNKTIKSININEELLSVDEKETLEELIQSGINSLFEEIDKEVNDKMGAFTNGLPF